MSRAPVDDQDIFLVRELIAGKEKAFKKLYEKYRWDIYAYSRSLLKSDANAEEIVQDVFLKVWLNCENLNPELSFKSYLFTIARNLAYNSLSKAANSKTLREELFYKSQKASNSTADTILDSDYESMKNQAVENLSPKRKVIFQMSRNEGKSYEEISQELDISVSTVKTQMSKALESIRGFLHMNSDLTFSVLIVLSLS